MYKSVLYSFHRQQQNSYLRPCTTNQPADGIFIAACSAKLVNVQAHRWTFMLVVPPILNNGPQVPQLVSVEQFAIISDESYPISMLTFSFF
jgi:hypothetical protein